MLNDGYRALIVDDELPVRTLLVRAMNQVGFRCEEAGDGKEAWRRFNEGKFDLVVTDLRMPVQHGHALCVQLVEAAQRPVIAVLTGIVEPRLSRDLESRGVDLIRTKPISFQKFARELLQLVRQRGEAAGSPSADQQATASQAAGAAAVQAILPAAAPSDQAKHIACVYMRDAEEAKRLAAEVSSKTTACEVVEHSDDLSKIIERQRIDLLIIENELGGFLTGTEIVDRLNRQLIRPRVILLAEGGREGNSQADELGIELIRSPKCDRGELAREAAAVLTEEAEHDVFIPPLARHLVKDFDNIPPLPQLVVKLAGYLSMPLNEIPIDELANDISADSKATTDLLKFTNSSSLGVRQTTSVVQAVKLHGPKRTISMLLTAATMSVQADALRDWNESHRQWYQKRSIFISATASVVAERLEDVSPDTAFILGLVQDIGCLVFSQKYGTRYDLIVRRVRQEGRARLHLLELESFNVHHAHVSAALLQKWSLPQSLIRPVIMHHDDLAEADLSKTDAAFLRAIRIGEALADNLDNTHPYREMALNKQFSIYGGRSSFDREALIAEALSKGRELSEVFSYPVPDATELESILRNSSLAMQQG